MRNSLHITNSAFTQPIGRKGFDRGKTRILSGGNKEPVSRFPMGDNLEDGKFKLYYDPTGSRNHTYKSKQEIQAW